MNQAEIEQQLKGIAFEAFEETGDWPTVNHVHVTIVRRGTPVPFYDVQQFFIHHSGAMTADSPASLSAADLQDVQAAQWLLGEFVNVVRLCAKKFMEGSDERPKITSNDLRNALLLDDLSVRKIHGLLQRSLFLTGSGAANVERTEWHYAIGSDAHFFKDVQDIRDYLAIVNALRQPVAASPEPESPPKPPIGFQKPTK